LRIYTLVAQALFYESAPFKIHSALLVDPPWWAQFLIAVARLFMTKVRMGGGEREKFY
jgi:hypothetical protein